MVRSGSSSKLYNRNETEESVDINSIFAQLKRQLRHGIYDAEFRRAIRWLREQYFEFWQRIYEAERSAKRQVLSKDEAIRRGWTKRSENLLVQLPCLLWQHHKLGSPRCCGMRNLVCVVCLGFVTFFATMRKQKSAALVRCTYGFVDEIPPFLSPRATHTINARFSKISINFYHGPHFLYVDVAASQQ